MAGFTAADVSFQGGRTFLVTGANTGVGFAAARVLARRGGRVLMGCRDNGRGEAAMEAIRAEVPKADLALVPLDLADLDSVRRAAAIVAGEARLDGLLNNAGVMFPPRGRTAQGFELQWGVNHLGPFALTALLLEKLVVTPGARVVNTSSLAHRRGRFDWDDPKGEGRYRVTQRYADSKLANLLHMRGLHRRLAGKGVSALACHPGFANTDLMRNLPRFIEWLRPIGGALINSAGMGAWPALQALTDPGAEAGGYYGPLQWGEIRGPSGPARMSVRALDEDAAERLWALSIAQTGVDPGLGVAW